MNEKKKTKQKTTKNQKMDGFLIWNQFVKKKPQKTNKNEIEKWLWVFFLPFVFPLSLSYLKKNLIQLNTKRFQSLD